MERIALAAILIVALAALARIVYRSVRPARRGASPACNGCPLAAECGSPDPPERADGADHGR